MRIDQVVPSFIRYDAISVHARNVHAALIAHGYRSELYFQTSTTDVANLGRPLSAMPVAADDRILIYHASTGSSALEVVARQGSPVVLDYHNITPASFFKQWSPSTSSEVALGRRQVAEFAPRAIGAIADSPLNERELSSFGYAKTAVAPLLIDLDAQSSDVNRPLFETLMAEKHARGGPSLLFVGSLAPHKAPQDLIAMLAAFRQIYHVDATLTLVGRSFGGRFASALDQYVSDLSLSDAVHFTGPLAPDDLEAHWRSSDVFVCASNHEGFCVPLLEAMSHNLPIVAFRAGAVPETLEDAGIILDDKEPVTFAAAIHRVLEDQPLRDALASAQNRQLERYALPHATKAFMLGLEAMIKGM